MAEIGYPRVEVGSEEKMIPFILNRFEVPMCVLEVYKEAAESGKTRNWGTDSVDLSLLGVRRDGVKEKQLSSGAKRRKRK